MIVSLQLTLEETDRLCRATQEAHFVLGQVEDTFDLIATLLEDGDHAHHHGIAAVARLASRALAGIYDRAPDCLSDLSQRLKQSRSKGEDE